MWKQDAPAVQTAYVWLPPDDLASKLNDANEVWLATRGPERSRKGQYFFELVQQYSAQRIGQTATGVLIEHLRALSSEVCQRAQDCVFYAPVELIWLLFSTDESRDAPGKHAESGACIASTHARAPAHGR